MGEKMMVPAYDGPELNTVYHSDAHSFLSLLPDASVHLQIFDPPYGIGYEAGYPKTNGGKSRVFSSTFGDDKLDTSWLPEAYRTLKPNAACYLFTQWQVQHLWHAALEKAGYKVRMLIVWDKLHWGQGNLDYYGCQTEMILFATKFKHRLNWEKREGNVWVLTKMDAINNEGNFDNPTQKPEALIRKAIARSSNPGDVVLDCFVGTGTTAAAARSINRNWYACDSSAYQIEIARERLSQPYKLSLFS